MFGSTIDTMKKKFTDAMTSVEEVHKNATAALGAAQKRFADVQSDVEQRRHAHVTSAEGQLAIVVAQRELIEAEDEHKRVSRKWAMVATKRGIANKDQEAISRDPETLLTDISTTRETIAGHEASLAAARQAYASRLADAQRSHAAAEHRANAGGDPGPLPLPAAYDSVGAPLAIDRFIEELSTMIASGYGFEPSGRLAPLRDREKELRASIEQNRIDEEKRAASRQQFVGGTDRRLLAEAEETDRFAEESRTPEEAESAASA